MPKFKEFLGELNKTLQNNEVEALAGSSAIADLDVTDDFMNDYKTKMSGLMSADAAKNNNDIETHFKKKLYGTIKGELLGNTDTDIVNTAKELFGDEVVDKFKEKDFTGDKVKLFGSLVKDKIQSSAGDSNLKQVNEGLNAKVSELNQAIVKLTKDNEKELKKKDQNFENTLIKKEFEVIFKDYNIGDNYKDDFVKNALQNDVFDKVSKAAKLKLIDGKVIPRDPENDTLEYYRDNQKVENLKGVIDPFMKPYIKASKTVDLKPGQSDYKPAAEVKKSRLAEDIIKRKAQKSTLF